MSPSRPLHRLTQACDYCRTRKVKCDLRRPSCANCENRLLPCHFSTIQHKRGPKPAFSSEKSEIERTYGSHGHDHHHSGASDSASNRSSYSDCNRPTQNQSPSGSVGTATILMANHDSSIRRRISRSQIPHPTPSQLFAFIYNDLEVAVDSLGLKASMPSLARTCVDSFFDCLYPLMPIVHRPKIELGLCLLQPGIERREMDLQVFALTVALCAITAAVVPGTIFSQGSLVADKFYEASKRSLKLYCTMEHPSSSSIATRYFQSGYTHSVGKLRTTWDELESAISIAQSMQLHDESSYDHMDELESQLCRRLFWILFTGDKSAGILGKKPHITLGQYLINSGITVQHSKSIEGEDPAAIQESTEPLPVLITGFNFNQKLWFSAYLVLLEVDILQKKRSEGEGGEDQPRGTLTSAELSHLNSLYIAFETSLGDVPSCLSAHPTLSLSPASFHFGQEEGPPTFSRAFALQRINLHVSYLCLRLVIIQAIATLQDSSNILWDATLPPWPNLYSINESLGSISSSSPGKCQPDSTPTYSISKFHTHGHESSALLLEKIRIAEDMLHILHTSTLENLRLNGESCVEKIRLVGVAMLELIDHNSESPLAGIAWRFKELYPHILAHLESKASDSLAEDA